MSIFSFIKKRKIKEVSSWSGAASNYSTPQAYAAASLINFNSATGKTRDEWTKDLIALPVREEGDSSDTYVKQAVQAASGGRGITRVTKPTEVSQEDFDRLIRSAANEITRAYGQWDGIAPDSVYSLAGKEAPKERATAFYDIFDRVYETIMLSDMAEDEYTMLIDIYYNEESNEFFALGLRDGKLVKMQILVMGDEIMLGEFEDIDITSMTRGKSDLKVYRDRNGKTRWLAIASVATLNRVKEIDSRQLYDSFITYANVTRKYPILNVYHLGDSSRIGIADFLARDNFVYIMSGTFDDNKFARAVYDALQREPGKWGNSIEFFSILSDVETFEAEGMVFNARVHKAGVNTAVSIILEKDAASVLTTHQDITRGGVAMNQELRNKLLDLFDGNEGDVDEFLQTVAQANDVATTRISRSIQDAVNEEVVEEVEREVEEEAAVEEEEVEQEEIVEAEAEEVTEVTEVELGETFVRDLVSSQEFADALTAVLNERLGKIEQRMNKLETVQEENQEWLDDIPAVAKKRTVVSYRPRSVAVNSGTPEQVTYADLAANTINEIFE